MKRSCFGFGTGLIVLFFLFSLYSTGYSEIRYSVNRGDTLSHISQVFSVPVESIKQANGLNGNALRLNQSLLIPRPGEKQNNAQVEKPKNQIVKASLTTEIKIENKSQIKPGNKSEIKSDNIPQIKSENKSETKSENKSYTVKKGDTLLIISKNTGVSVDDLKKANHLQSSSLSIGQVLALAKSNFVKEEKFEEAGEAEPILIEPLADEGKDAQERHAEPLGRWQTPEEKGLLVRVVKTFLGVPYRLGGSNVRGIDCSAFVKRVYQIFNVDLPRTTREQLNIGKWIKRQELQEGDLVFFKIQRLNNNAHVGIYIGNNQFIHASSHDKEVKVDNLDAPYFNKSFYRGVRVLETETDSPMS